MSKYIGDVSAYAYAVSKGYTGTEEEFAELMASYADVGQTAVNAKDAAVAAKTAAQTAATTATNKASEATTAATTATTKAGEASQSASQASASAQTASTKASEASQSASTASAKATEATTAAGTATTAKNDAVSAKTAAETAQGKAETAQGAAEDAAESVSASAAQIATNTSDISDLKEDLSHKANVDGYYADLVSGGSTQLLSDMVETDTTPYNYRTAGGSLEIGDREKLKKIVGGSLAVNQLVPDLGTLTSSGSKAFNNGTAKIAGHKYLFSANISADGNTVGLYSKEDDVGTTEIILRYSVQSAIISAKKTATSDGTSNNSNGNMWLYPYIPNGSISNIMFFDLTAMFGTTIADYVYGLETATAGAGVAWLKSHFPRIFDSGYIPYNAGTLEHVSGLSAHKMVGFNQWDTSKDNLGKNLTATGELQNSSNYNTSDYIKVVPNTTYYFMNVSPSADARSIAVYDSDKNFIEIHVLSGSNHVANGEYTIPSNGHYIRVVRYATITNVCINLHWDGERDGEYEPYEEHSYPIDSDVTLRGIPKLDANNNLYYDGDEYVADGTVTRRYGIVDLGTLDWYLSTLGTNTFLCEDSYRTTARAANFVCPKFTNSGVVSSENMPDKSIQLFSTGNYFMWAKDTDYTDAATFKAAMSGVYLVYELATPTTESADPYTEIQNVSNWGTEEFVTTSLVPVGHETAYQPDLRAKIEVAPESPDGDGLYLMKRENGQNSYVAYLGELPTDPTTDGTYTLKCTVSGGTATKTWEADE